MEVSIRILKEKKLVGKRITMSFSDNKTGELWKGFMSQRKEIRKIVGTNLYSIQLYSPQFFSEFNPDAEFEKWAAVEVSDFESVPGQMETFTLESGLYAVFLYHGAADDAANTFGYILGEWIRDSDYDLDNRPHFEILGEKYKNESPDSEEELWIPVRPKVIACSITPWLTVRNSEKAIDFYKSAFGAIEVYRLEGDAGDLVVRLSVDGAEFWISNGTDEDTKTEALGGGTVRMVLRVPDPDTLFLRALKAGATEVFPVGEEHGWRLGRLSDPFGLHWEIGKPVIF